ncbi:hypothetical protein Tco_0546409 [Tanacetum coccineum]
MGASLESHQDLIGSGHQELKSCRIYGALIHDEMINKDIKDSKLTRLILTLLLEKTLLRKQGRLRKLIHPQRNCVVIRDTPGVYMSKKKAPTKADRGKGMDLISDAALLEAAQLKKTLKKSMLETKKLHASGSDEGTGTKPRVPDVPKYQSESENKSWGDSKDDDSNDDDSDDVSNDDDDVDSDAGGDIEPSNGEKTDFDEDENPNLNQNEDEEEEYEEELKDTEHEEEGKGDADMTDAGHDDGTQQTTYEQVKDDEHVRHEEPSTQTPSLLNIPVMVILETSTTTRPTIPLTIPPINYFPQQSTLTPTPTPTTATTTTLISALPDFSSLFRFDQRVSALEKELS